MSDSTNLLQRNRDHLESALAKLEGLSRRIDDIEQAQLRSAERERWLCRQARESAASSAIPVYGSVFAKRSKEGLAIFIDGRDADAPLLHNDFAGFNVNRLLPKLLKPGGVFVDIGAKYGYFSLMAALFVGEKGRVHCFEPNSTLTPLIERSVAANGLNERVRIWNNAASNRAGTALFGFDPVFPGGGSLAQGDSANPEIWKLEVERKRVDDVLGEDIIADCVKLSARGHEAAVLRGMSGLLRRSPNLALIVKCEGRAETGGKATLEMIDELAALGYTVWRISSAGFLEDVTREELLSGKCMYLLCARSRPQGSEISWDGEGGNRPDMRAQDPAAMPANWLVCGPGWPLARGAYEVEIYGDIAGTLELCAFHEGDLPLARRLVAGVGQPLSINLSNDVRHFTIVVKAATEDASLRLDRIAIRDLTTRGTSLAY